MRARVLLVMAAGLLLAADKPKDDAKGDKDKFQGSWKVVSGEHDGVTLPEEKTKELTVTFQDDKVTIRVGDKTEPEQTFKLDPAKKPREIDVTPHAKGIYELKGDDLKIRFARGSEYLRHASFAYNEIPPDRPGNIIASSE